jgi:hypothetical protein
MLQTQIRKVAAFAVLIAWSFSVAAQDPSLAAFKNEFMPQVGKQITVEGILQLGKLGWRVEFKGWGIYLYAKRDSDMGKVNALNRFAEQYVTVTGTLRYSPAPQTPSGPLAVAVVPEHFFFDVAEAKVVSNQKQPFIQESTRKPLVVAAAPEECLRTFREFFRYVQRPEPSIVKDETAQQRWLSKNLREALKQKVATFNDRPNDPDFPGNGTFVGTWDSPTTFTIMGSRRYGNRAVIDVWYSWGKGTNYPGDTRLSYFVFVLEDYKWKLDDVYTFRGEYASAESLNAYLTSK